MRKLIVSIFLLGFAFGQFDELAGRDDKQVKMFRQMEAKIAFLESQLGQSYVAPAVSEAVLVDIQYEIDNAADWFYKTPRVECVVFVESMKTMVEDNKLPQAVEVIDFLIANQAKYFYKSYNRRPKTVARFEAIKAQLE